MSSCNNTSKKSPMTESFGSIIHQGENEEIPRPIYNDAKRFIEKGTSIKWGEVFHMFKKKSFPRESEEDLDLKIFKNIKKSKLHRVEAHTTIFPCANTISWKVRHVDLGNRYILNANGDPMISFQASNISSYYHLEKGDLSLDEYLIKKFSLKAKDLFKLWYNPGNSFKIRASGKYSTSSLRTSYQYIVAVLYRVYGEHDSSNFTLSMVPII
jgi:hypothetical protein